ncbi:MAG TPA: tRNA lysidine(34) synthetase TilS [Bacteroidales bacterium]|nr:tRNA lysidine(34) synthetase TilS [Bacteroidales bacterium]
MFERFEKYLKSFCKCLPTDKIIVAVSGGADSMSLLHMLYKAKYDIIIAHCNFQLRGEESDNEEQLVRQTAAKLDIPIYVKRFETTEYASLKNISIQMAARELRYSWFENLRRNLSYHKIAVAHNADDNIETFFINLIRGTGIAGLTGMKAVSGNIVRPLLFATREEIEAYCQTENIVFATDSSNLSDKYLRNNIRHNIVPLLRQMNGVFDQTMLDNLKKLQGAYAIYSDAIKNIINEIVSASSESMILIDIRALLNTVEPSTVLFEILKEYNFSPVVVSEIYNSLDADSGKQFFSESHWLVKDRDKLIVSRLSEDKANNEDVFYIFEDTEHINIPISMSFIKSSAEGYEIKKNPNIAALDYDKLVFPLILRHWRHGDYFIPMGMKGIKKVSDFFVDKKLSLPEKESVWLLFSAGELVWVTGMRIDERYKITNGTQQVYEVEVGE